MGRDQLCMMVLQCWRVGSWWSQSRWRGSASQCMALLTPRCHGHSVSTATATMETISTLWYFCLAISAGCTQLLVPGTCCQPDPTSHYINLGAKSSQARREGKGGDFPRPHDVWGALPSLKKVHQNALFQEAQFWKISPERLCKNVFPWLHCGSRHPCKRSIVKIWGKGFSSLPEKFVSTFSLACFQMLSFSLGMSHSRRLDSPQELIVFIRSLAAFR